MAKVANQPRCALCGTKLVKNGKSSSGKTRWRCKSCGASSTLTRPDITAKAQFTQFHHWATSKHSVAETGTARSTFYRNTAWCWNVKPHLATTGEEHRYLMLDGTYFNGYCVLTAYNGEHVIDWQFCDREKTASWTRMLQRMTPPQIVVIDGHGALESVICALWPQTVIQRCYFHIRQSMVKHLTQNPRTVPGQQLLALTKALMKIRTSTEAQHWITQFNQWHSMHEITLKQRTYAKDRTAFRPSYIPPTQSWWYTHIGLRRGDRLLRELIEKEHLFSWLHYAVDEEELPRTTSPLEGAVNAGIKSQLRAHRGLKPEHAQRIIDWYLYQFVEDPQDPWSFVRPEHWQQNSVRPQAVEDVVGPPLYDTHFSWQDGNGVQKGWGGGR